MKGDLILNYVTNRCLAKLLMNQEKKPTVNNKNDAKWK